MTIITRSMARNFPKKRFHADPYPTNKRQKKEPEEIPDYSMCMIFMLLLMTVLNLWMLMFAYQLQVKIEFEHNNITTV